MYYIVIAVVRGNLQLLNNCYNTRAGTKPLCIRHTPFAYARLRGKKSDRIPLVSKTRISNPEYNFLRYFRTCKTGRNNCMRIRTRTCGFYYLYIHSETRSSGQLYSLVDSSHSGTRATKAKFLSDNTHTQRAQYATA